MFNTTFANNFRKKSRQFFSNFTEFTGLSEDEITEIITQANCLREEDKEKVRESLRTLEFNSDPEYISIGCGWRAPRSTLREQAIDKIHCFCKYGDEIA